ncbi:MAG: helix-turn-helix transcriptional regulator [Gammaproteobacteria bacterium]|jgi:DNA-binding CsgD family transcriptional regulator
MLAESLQEDRIAVCVKDSDGKVLEQNALCRVLCGDCQGQVCRRGCMELYAGDDTQQWRQWGSRVYKNSRINDKYFDITLLCSDQHIVTFLQPLKDQYEKALRYYRERGLTRRETDVVALLIRGKTNPDICSRLSISRATLRTHLNNIYRKVRDLGEAPPFLPANRMPG